MLDVVHAVGDAHMARGMLVARAANTDNRPCCNIVDARSAAVAGMRCSNNRDIHLDDRRDCRAGNHGDTDSGESSLFRVERVCWCWCWFETIEPLERTKDSPSRVVFLCD